MEFFNNLGLQDKEKLLSEQGRYLLTTNFYGSAVKLYSLNASFVEVYYHPVLRKVMRISIAQEEELKKHLVSINFTI